MNVQQLIYVIEVDKWKSFSIAAKNNYVSQSRISKAIIDLEKELGFEIFIRNSKGISLITAEGMEFLKKANEVVQKFESFKLTYSKDYQRIKICTVNLNCVKKSYGIFLQQMLDKEEFVLSIDTGTTFEVCENILKNDYDLGVVVVVDELKHEWEKYFDKIGLEYTQIKELISYFLISKEDNELIDKEYISFDDLKDYIFVQLSHDNSSDLNYFDYVMQILEANKLKKFTYVYDKSLSYEIVAKNKAFCSEADACIDYNKFEKLGLICKKYKTPHLYNLGILKKKNRKLSKEVNTFIEILSR